MKERPILFSTPMVQPTLDGMKSQTRRTKGLDCIQEIPFGTGLHRAPYQKEDMGWYYEVQIKVDDSEIRELKCPYGKPGDWLWVRETWAPNPWRYLGGCKYIFRADYEGIPKCEIGTSYPSIDKWKPSIFMPREACRIILEVTDVRVERLQDITEEDAKAEGITDIEFYPDEGFPLSIGHMAGKDDGKTSLHTTRAKAYTALWESINGKGSWEKNPWVWVIGFKKIEP